MKLFCPSASLLLQYLLQFFLFFLPWQTIFILREPWVNGAKWEYGTIGWYATEVILWIAVVVFLFWYVGEWKKERGEREHGEGEVKFAWAKDRVFVFFCLLFILYCSFSFLWAPDPTLAHQQALRVTEVVLLFFMLFLGPLSVRRAGQWLVAGAFVPALLGIWQFLSQTTVASRWFGLASHPAFQAGTSIIAGHDIGRWVRAYGTFAHPNVFGGYLTIALVLTALLYKTYVANGTNKLALCTLHSALCTQSAALFFTFSRSAWLATLLLITGLMLWFWRWHIWSIIGSTILVGIIFSTIFFPLVHIRVTGDSPHEVQSIQERVGGYRDAWQLVQAHPWLGVGAGNYTVALQTLHPGLPGWAYQPVHSVPLLALVEIGVLGVALFFMMVIIFFRYQIAKKNMSPLFAIRYSLFVFAISFLPLALFDHYFWSSSPGLFFVAVLFALVLRLHPHSLHK